MKKLPHDFNFRYHLIGRIWTALAIVLFISVPITLGLYYGETPDWKVFGTSAVIIPLLINFISGIVEPIIYAPMLGTNGEYLAFITGNLSNLKIPCVVKAQEICGTKVGSEEHEVVCTLAVATSTLVTVVIIAVLVLCLGLSNLQAVVSRNEWIMPAFTCVVYALFGSLGGKYVAKNPKLALIPAAIIVVLSVILGVTGVSSGIGSAYLFIGIAICGAFAACRFAMQKKKQRAEEESARLAGIDDTHEMNDKTPTPTQADETASASDENASTEDENASDENKAVLNEDGVSPATDENASTEDETASDEDKSEANEDETASAEDKA